LTYHRISYTVDLEEKFTETTTPWGPFGGATGKGLANMVQIRACVNLSDFKVLNEPSGFERKRVEELLQEGLLGELLDELEERVSPRSSLFKGCRGDWRERKRKKEAIKIWEGEYPDWFLGLGEKKFVINFER
jgi:hypothetical protein